MENECKATPQQISEARMRTAMASPNHLRVWAEASGRRWLVFHTGELIDALPWPAGVEAFMQIVAAYRDHRAAIPSGRVEVVTHPLTGEKHKIPITKGETLEVDELDRAIRYLIGQITEKDPTWTLTSPPR